ncbi:MAG: RNA methyltransferase [Micrococcaceae bacterium]
MTPERLEYNVIANPRSERVKAVAKLSRRSVRYREQRFLVEGPQSVREALKQPALVQEIYYTERGRDSYQEIYQLAQKTAKPLFQATEAVLDKMSPDAAHQGWLLVYAMEESDAPSTINLAIYLEEVKDPGNVGTIIRVADAVGADAVFLSNECVDIYNSKVIRSTAGSLFHLPLVQNYNLDDVLALGLRSIVADGYAQHDIFHDKQLDQPTLWIFGNEAHGVSQEALSKADCSLAIPMFGDAESLNVATAATVCLYASCREQRL